MSWDDIRALPTSSGTKLHLQNAYKHDFEVWQAAHASRDAEVEALRKDTERYRWLSARTCVEDRDGGWSSSYHFYPVARHSGSTYGGAKPFHHGTLNEAIDAAMQERMP